LCESTLCNLCQIVKESFSMSHCGERHPFRRFGRGIYITPCSSKADDYTLNLYKSGGKHVVLLARVVLGNTYTRYRNDATLSAAPPGFHSIHGKAGKDLNYEEMAVYTDHAIRPAYVLVYDAPKPTFFWKLLRTSMVQ